MNVDVIFKFAESGDFFVVGDDDSLGNWDPKKGKAGNVKVSVPLNRDIKFKVIRKLTAIDVEWEGKDESDNRTLRVVSKYKTKDSVVIDLSFNILQDFIDVEAPPIHPQNGYQLFCAENQGMDAVKRFLKWRSMSEAQQDEFIERGDKLHEDYKVYREIMKVRNANNPLPPELHPQVPEGDTIKKFLEKHPKWVSGKAYIALRDDPRFRLSTTETGIDALTRIINYRFQKTGSCFAQASILEYKYVMSYTEKDIHMLNMHEAVKLLVSDKASALEHGQTKPFLKSLFSPETRIKRTDDVAKGMKMYGPLVGSHLHLDLTFKDKELSEHYLYDRMEDWGTTHAVVFHGYREEDGQVYFLIQNTWKGKQFVELSAEYVSKSKGILYHVENPKKADVLIPCIEGNCSEMDVSDESFLFDE